MKLKALLLFLSLTITHSSLSQTTEDFFNSVDTFLNQYVADGKVDYSELKTNASELNKLIEFMSKVSLADADASTIQAFYINSYNISVIKGIVDHYPLSSPLDKPGFFDIITYKVSGEDITLNDIENKKLRTQYGDARFHFVLVCGAVGCPPLISSAYLPDRLEYQLQTQTIKALNNPDFIKVKKHKVQLSEIFKWYKEDFIKAGSEIDFINRYRTHKINPDSKLSYYPYNWSLNQY